MLKPRFLLTVLLSVAGAWLIARTVKDSVIDFVRVTNESMLPYLKPGQSVAITKFSPCLHLPLSGKSVACSPCEVGKAYVFLHPHKAGLKLVKFAAPFPQPPKGTNFRRDIMWFTQGEHASLSATASAPQQVAETMNRDHTCYFVGSNAEISVDSRNFGPIHMHAVLGKVVFPQVTLQPSNAQLNQTPL